VIDSTQRGLKRFSKSEAALIHAYILIQILRYRLLQDNEGSAVNRICHHVGQKDLSIIPQHWQNSRWEKQTSHLLKMSSILVLRSSAWTPFFVREIWKNGILMQSETHFDKYTKQYTKINTEVHLS
jgi:hypothetical protein